MGSKSMEYQERINEGQEKGNEISELGQQKLDEAAESNDAFISIERVDEDDEEAVESATAEAQQISSEIANGEIREPSSEVGESLHEVSEEATESGDTEDSNAETAAEMTGDYSDVGSNLSSEFTQSGEEYRRLSELSEGTSEQLQAEHEQAAAALESIF